MRPFQRRTLQLVVSCVIGLAVGAGAQAQSENSKAAKFYEDALVRYEKKDVPGAIIQLKNALQVDPNMLPVQLLLGKALMESGDVAAAEVAFKESLRLGVNRAEVVVLLGQAYIAQGKQAELLEATTFMTTGLPTGLQVKVNVLRATAYSDLGNVVAALRALDEARAINRQDAEIWLAEVPIRVHARQFKEAGTAADTALAIAPAAAEALYQRGSVFHAQGDLRAALAAYDRALQADSKHVEARVARIGISLDLGQFSEATKDVAALRSAVPTEPRGAYMRALLAERSGDIPASQSALKEVTELIDPIPFGFLRYRPQLLMLNGLAHFGLKQNEKAKQYLEAFLRVQSDSPVSKLLSRIYMADRNYALAINVLEPYLRAQPGDGQALTLLANAHMASGRNVKATALMQEALKSQDSPAFRTTLGLSLIGSGRTADGISELEAAYRKDPRQVQAATTLIRMYLQTSQARKAVPVAEQLVKAQGSNAFFHNLLGMALGQSGNLTGARASFEKAIALDGRLQQAKLNLSRLDIAVKAYDAATTRLNDLLKINTADSEALYELAVIAERKGQLTEAQRWLEKARDAAGASNATWDLALIDFHLRHDQTDLALDSAKSASAKRPEDMKVLLAYSRAQIAKGDTVAAKSSLNTATRLAEYDPQLQVRIAILQMSAKNLAGAAYSLEKALSGHPNFLPALEKMAQVELRQGNYESAEKRARDIIAQHPKLPIGYSLQGDIALARQQMAGAIDGYRKAHQIAPNTASLLQLFRVLSSQDNSRSALNLAEQWLNSHPQDLTIRKALADGYARAGDFKSAKSAYEAALKLYSGDAEALNNLANVQLRLKDPGAVKTAEAALANAPGNAIIVDTLGWALFLNGQSDRALQLLRDARLRQPGNPEIRYHLATVLAQSGRRAEAKDELLTALKNKVDFEGRPDAEKLFQSLQ